MDKMRILPAALMLSVAFTLPALAESEADRIARVTQPTTDFTKPEKYEIMQGGAATHRKRINGDAFSLPSANMAFARRLWFELGDGMFKKMWVSAPASTKSSDGLGPLYNARSCQRCHLKDGRGAPPGDGESGTDAVGLLLRLSVPPRTGAEEQDLADGTLKSIADPVYGGQLQTFAIHGLPAEADLHFAYEPHPVTLSDGTVVRLRKPKVRLDNPGYGPLPADLMISPRIAAPMIGLGLLEAISEADILSHADPEDVDGDGISGRANRVRSAVEMEVKLGRFGWKANQASLKDQVADAFSGDIGISTSISPANAGDCTRGQPSCLALPDGGDPQDGDIEVSDHLLDLVTFYSRNLAVPARRDVGTPEVLAGKKLFYESGCIACHRPKFVTPRDPLRPEQSFQLIWPYSDMLLHNMGDGLADNRPDGLANGREWRTPPLWGIGLTEAVSGHTYFLHDGRARNLLEAILWHGGEAAAARDHVIALSSRDRDALLRFLKSL